MVDIANIRKIILTIDGSLKIAQPDRHKSLAARKKEAEVVEGGDDKHGLKKVPVEMVELVWDIQRWFKRLRAHTQESSCKIVIEHGWVRDIHF